MENPWYVRVPSPEVGGRQAVADRFPNSPTLAHSIGNALAPPTFGRFLRFGSFHLECFGGFWLPPGGGGSRPRALACTKLWSWFVFFLCFPPFVCGQWPPFHLLNKRKNPKSPIECLYSVPSMFAEKSQDWLYFLPPLWFRWHRRRGVSGGR